MDLNVNTTQVNMEKPASKKEIKQQQLEFQDDSHMSHILSQLREMHKRGQFCDAKLILGDHETGIHRAVLASASTYFFKMFENDEDDKNRETYKLKDISWDTFRPLLDFVYTGRLVVAKENVKAVYKLSQDLRIHSATTACAQHLITGLTPDNCLGIRSFAAEESFRDRVNQYITENIRDVANSKKFYGLSKISLEIVVPDEHTINMASNDEVVEAILVWMKNKFPDYKNKIDALTEDLIVLYLNSDSTLTDCNEVEDATVQENELVQDYKKLTRKKQSGKVVQKDTASLEAPAPANYRKFSIDPYSPKTVEWSIVTSYKTKNRSYMVIAMLNDNLVTMLVHYRPAISNGSGTDDPDSPVHCNGVTGRLRYDSTSDLSPLMGMSTNRCAFGLKVLDGKLFACGGYDRGECLMSSEIYNVDENVWTPAGDMKSARGRFSIGVYENKVYAFGGSSGNHDMKTVECYDGATEKWSLIAEAPRGKASPGIAVVHGKLYVLGGCIGQTTVSTCETLDLTTNTWEIIAAMRLQRYQVAVTVFGKKIYAIGGTNGWKCLNEVEAYDPATNEWSQLSPLNIARRGAGIDIYQGKIFVVGGNDGQSALNSIEIYDPETHTWNLGPNMSVARANCGAAVINDRLYAVGGFNGKKFLNSIEYLDLQKKEYWSQHVRLELNIHQVNDVGDESTENDDVIKIAKTSCSRSNDVIRNDEEVVISVEGGGKGTNTGQPLSKPAVQCENGLQLDIKSNGDRNS